MDFNFIQNQNGLCVTRVYGLDSIVEIPEADFGEDITEVSPYCFAQLQRGLSSPETMYGDEAIAGEELTELSLPRSIRKIGAYALYNCTRLRRLSLYSSTTDLGAGFLTGCTGLEYIDIYLVEGSRSCLKELLFELRQTLRVRLMNERGELLTELIFPEFYENTLENTPGRILMRDVHGSGIMYRNCFIGTDFQPKAYDRLLKEAALFDGEELAAELAVKRLMHPWQLLPESREQYERFLLSHLEVCADSFDLPQLRCLCALPLDWEGWALLLERIPTRGEQLLTAFVMNAAHERRRAMPECSAKDIGVSDKSGKNIIGGRGERGINAAEACGERGAKAAEVCDECSANTAGVCGEHGAGEEAGR